jgi:hypothetical protein
MDLDWYCTDMLKVWHQCQCVLLWTFSSLKRQGSPHQYIRFHMFNIQANRFVIVSSAITKIFNPIASGWQPQFNLFWMTLFLISACIVYCQLFLVRLLFVSVLSFNSVFYSLQCFCSIWFFCSVFKLFSVCSVLILKMYPRYLDPVKHKSSSSQ